MQKYSFDDLNGKVCVITGGGGVIGAVLAKGLASVGAKVAILDIKKEFADKVADEIARDFGTEAIGVEANVLDKSSLEESKKIVVKKFGLIDILINGAGGNSPKATTKEEFITDENVKSLENTFFGLELEGFQKVFDLNFLGTLLPIMVYAKEMVERKSGVILNVS